MSWKNVQYENGKRRTSDVSPAGSSTLSGLDDVSLSSPSNDQVLTYDSTEQKWKNKDASGGTVTDVEYGGSSVVDQNGVAKIPKAPISDVQVNDSSVVDQDGVAKVVVPDAPVQDVTYNGTSVVNQNGVAVVPVPNIPVTDVEVNGQSVLDNKVAKVVSYKEVTEAEYNALPASKLSDGVLYAIKDSIGAQEGFPPLIYSDEERQVGVWRDGKPLYQKTVYIGTMTADNTNHGIAHNIDNIDLVVDLECFAINASGNFYPIPIYRVGQTTGVMVGVSTSEVFYTNNWTAFSDKAYATIKYTKTTDTPGSGMWNTQGGLAHHYSTTEHIIGTWIDGKPIYEKVITGTFTSGATTLELNYNIGDGFVINFWGFLIPSDNPIRRRPIGSNFGNNGNLVFNGYSMTSVTVKRSDGQYWGNTPSVQVVIQYTKTTD